MLYAMLYIYLYRHLKDEGFGVHTIDKTYHDIDRAGYWRTHNKPLSMFMFHIETVCVVLFAYLTD